MTIDAPALQRIAGEAAALRRVFLVADDYGISLSVNAAIRDLIARGRLSATSVMVVAPSFGQGEADSLTPLWADGRCSVGLHFTLTAPFAPLSAADAPTRNGRFLPLTATAARALFGRLDARAVTAECEAQIAAFAHRFGRPPDFVDGHQHVQLFPIVSEALLRAVKRLAPAAWVRQCGQATPWRRGGAGYKAVVLDLLSQRFRRRARAAGVAANPAFAGAYDFRPDADFAALFAGFLADLPDGGVIMCHPGKVDAELQRLDPLTTLREREFEFFCSERFAEMLANQRIALTP